MPEVNEVATAASIFNANYSLRQQRLDLTTLNTDIELVDPGAGFQVFCNGLLGTLQAGTTLIFKSGTDEIFRIAATSEVALSLPITFAGCHFFTGQGKKLMVNTNKAITGLSINTIKALGFRGWGTRAG